MNLVRLAIVLSVALSASSVVSAQQLPSDVRPTHWAAPAVTRTVKAKILPLQTDGQFHGDAKMTHAEAVIALAALGRSLAEGTWTPAGRSRPVPDSVASIWEKTNWKTEPVRRYTFAVITARFGDYVANALKRPAEGANVGKSEVLPTVTPKVAPSNPAYDAMKYLADNHMIKPGSPLLKADAAPLLGGELSRALAELATGTTDKFVEPVKDTDNPTPNGAQKGSNK